ncbi:hypothetical protein [Leptospira kmetyi]|uniref:Uncharacterized protein n=1 Tax=Leptospira kmetyi TaxID=408139 RepID=A0ABX4N6Y5_9LEPT|nr:hypothetical protein [Leptospira kmetyi]PJZ29064.1 hypothetical protein CH378_14330 [Leptospira kmetyi]
MRDKEINRFQINRLEDVITAKDTFVDDPCLNLDLKGCIAIGIRIQFRKEVTLSDLWNATSDKLESILNDLKKLQEFGYVERIEYEEEYDYELSSRWKFHETSLRKENSNLAAV